MSEPQFEVLVGADPDTGALPEPTAAWLQAQQQAYGDGRYLQIGDEVDIQDTVIAAAINDPDSDTKASLDATYATRHSGLLGRRWVFDGDSITANSATSAQTPGAVGLDYGSGWVTVLTGLSGGRIYYASNAGNAGDILSDGIAKFDTYVTPVAPEVVFATFGTNDISSAVPLATFLTQWDAYKAKCDAIGARLVVGGIYPNTANAAATALWNKALAQWCRTNNVTGPVPFWELADPANGAWPSGWSLDGIHPNNNPGCVNLGVKAWEYLEPYCGPSVAPTPMYNGDGLATNGLLLTLAPAVTGSRRMTAAPTTGSLAAGEYTYRVVTANSLGWKSGVYNDTAPITLGAPGGVTLTNSATSGSFGTTHIYRKKTGDANFVKIAQIANPTTTYTDDGTATPREAWLDGDFSQTPTGVSTQIGTSRRNDHAPVFTEPGIRGNIYHVAPASDGSLQQDIIQVTGLTPGTDYDLTCKFRGHGTTGVPNFMVQWRSSGGSVSGNEIVRMNIDSATWLFIHREITCPAGADRLWIDMRTASSDSTCWAEIAEVYVGVKP